MKILSSIEIACVVKELQNLLGAKVSQVYQPDNIEIVLSFHKTGLGKQLLRLVPGQCLYLTFGKRESPKRQKNFCRFLRKRLNQSRLRKIEQKNNERIVEFFFEAKENNFYLIVEFFSKGNIILCDENKVIISALQVQIWKDRKIKARVHYEYPPSQANDFFSINKIEFKKMILESKKENVVKTLALNLGLGGIYAEYICSLAKIKKEKKHLNEKEIDALFNVVKDLRKLNIKAILTKDNCYPFEIEKGKQFERFNDALNDYYSQFMEFEEEKEKDSAYEKKLKKIKDIIQQQLTQIKTMEKAVKENKIKGDLIYENYSYVDEILKTINRALAKNIPWVEIKKKLKTKNILLNTKEKKVSFELQ